MTQRRGLDCALVTDGAASAWLQIDGVLWLVGSIAWLVGLAEQWRLRRRFEEKTGEDLYGLEELATAISSDRGCGSEGVPGVAGESSRGGKTRDPAPSRAESGAHPNRCIPRGAI